MSPHTIYVIFNVICAIALILTLFKLSLRVFCSVLIIHSIGAFIYRYFFNHESLGHAILYSIELLPLVILGFYLWKRAQRKKQTSQSHNKG